MATNDIAATNAGEQRKEKAKPFYDHRTGKWCVRGDASVHVFDCRDEEKGYFTAASFCRTLNK